MAAGTVPIEDVSRELALIARRRGWRVTAASRDASGGSATIEKDGVVLDFGRHNADRSETVYLRRPIHPRVALYPYREPTIGDVLAGIGIGIGVACGTEGGFTAIADHLPVVKKYLSDPAIFHRHVLAQAERIHATYLSLEATPAFNGVRAALLSRHRWLDDGMPTVDALLIAPSSGSGGGGGYRIAVILLAVAIGMMIARTL